MNVDRGKSHRLAWSTAIAVLVVAFGAPLASAAGVQVPAVTELPVPVEQPPLPGAPAAPELPNVDPPLPVPDVTTVPVPVQELTDGVGSVVDGTTDVVDGVTGGGTGDVVDEVVDDVTGGAGEVVDDVTDPDGPVGGIVDDVKDPEGPVGGVVDKVEDVTKPVGDVVSGVADEVGNNAGSVVDKVDGIVGGVPGRPDTPGFEGPGLGGLDPDTGSGAGTAGDLDTAEVAAALAERIAATVPLDGFAASVLAARETAAAFTPPAGDLPEPSLVERIARSLSEVASEIAFPLLLALAVGAFVIVQDRVDRKDPKLALAAVEADEDLLGFE